jgi:hypothetical protein
MIEEWIVNRYLGYSLRSAVNNEEIRDAKARSIK